MPSDYQVHAALEALWNSSKRIRDYYSTYRWSRNGYSSKKAFWITTLFGTKADWLFGLDRDVNRPKEVFKEWESEAVYAMLQATETVDGPQAT